MATIKDRKKLKEKAWEVFSEYVRLRDLECYTCGKRIWDEELGEWTIKGLQAGHFWHGVLDFDEENIHAQCRQCNHFKSGSLAEYSARLIHDMGKKKFDALDKRHREAQKGELLSAEDYEHIIDKYQKKISNMNCG